MGPTIGGPPPRGARDRSPIERAFGCPIAFGARRAELTFDRALGDALLIQANSPLHAVLIEYAQSLHARLPERRDIADQVRAQILQALRPGSQRFLRWRARSD